MEVASSFPFSLSRGGAPVALVGSFLLHGLLALGFLIPSFFGWMSPDVPRGVYIDLVASSSSLSTPLVAPRLASESRPRSKVLVPKGNNELPAEAAQAADTIGNVSSAADSAAGAVGSPDGAEASARERYLYELRLFLQSRLTYPPIALTMGQEGTVLLRFRIDDNGAFEEVTIAEPSAFGILNRAALQLVQANSQWRALPESQRGSGGMLVTLPVDYTIR
jgi:periplasmic protein TonB